MDKIKLRKDVSDWQEEYLKTVEEKLGLLSTDELMRAMKKLEHEYSDERLNSFKRETMITSLVAESRDPSLMAAYTVLGGIESNVTDADILNSVSGLIQTISKTKEGEKSKEMNAELVEKLKGYEEE
jgi:hypothetical protein